MPGPTPSQQREEMLTSEGESLPKRQKMTGPLIGTHNGHFHADEALAVFMLRLLPTYKQSPLVRTRDPSVLQTCHTVVDVGGEYTTQNHRYDHHQREFTTTFDDIHATKLSSAGLVYKHFGKDIIAQQTALALESGEVELLYQKLYDDLIEAFDANDNGISVYDTTALSNSDIKKRFEDRGFSLASVVNRYNHAFEQSSDSDNAEEKQRKEDERFAHASAFVGQQFIMELSDKHHSWLPARSTVQTAYNNRLTHHSSGKIMVLPEGLPWADHLYTLERLSSSEKGIDIKEAQVLYVLFPENDTKDSKWRIRAVGVEGGGFDNRKDLPDKWKGLRDEELSKVSGVPGGVFIHAGGFIGGNKTFEGALGMAVKAVEL
ncbi:metal-dependent protein hydrolase [Tothia fuscella]|uniref:Metal-dependent protein hydrolase n=1 Tax=Tothia fuscella TaxID=1048955 RepID=A0A9P4NVJ9_9PEZI|nr:metal-dependent protein hydrolase [Tothia fuscella]